ncbi:MAG: murD [Burkholderiales bacterium]|jgi:UDP-N-acetylmuramoylalanine--D-glutamate ligase|nr:murD [Burkholderiales bacterium]
MKNIDFKKHKFAVIGLGDTGLSIIDYLRYQNANLTKVFDTRDTPPHREAVSAYQLFCGKLEKLSFDDIDVIVISPGISIYEPVLQELITQGKIIVGDIELFALAVKDWPSKIIGITGSNGKTTVTTLTGYLADASGYTTLVAGNIGVPVLQSYIKIMQTGDIPQIIVLELSSFQLETTYSLNLVAATVLNISEDHLDRYRDLLEYAYAKSHIFNNCKTQVLNISDPLVMSMSRSACQHAFFGNEPEATYKLVKNDDGIFLNINSEAYIEGNKLGLVGLHNYQNVLASLALLSVSGIDIFSSQFKDALENFKGLEHRMQKVGVVGGITYIEDSKGTNVGAVVAGVSGLDRPVHLILGGDGKGQDFSPLVKLVANYCKSVAILGQDKYKINDVLSGLSMPIKLCDSLEECIVFCNSNAVSGEYVVLSPACASWDMFDNYKHRAQVFKDFVLKHIEKMVEK